MLESKKSLKNHFGNFLRTTVGCIRFTLLILISVPIFPQNGIFTNQSGSFTNQIGFTIQNDTEKRIQYEYRNLFATMDRNVVVMHEHNQKPTRHGPNRFPFAKYYVFLKKYYIEKLKQMF